MKRDTRQEILDSASKLFNESGYNGVSLRDIAGAVGISKGNLTYHFSKKEEIMEALLSESQDTMPAGTPQTLEELDAVFLDKQKAVQEHSYYFLYHAQLAQLSPEICQKQNIRYREYLVKFRDAFSNLHQTGYLRDELYAGEYDCIIDLLHMSSIYWAPFSELQKPVDRQIEYRRLAWSILYRLLTDKGRDELNKIIQL